MVRQYVCGVQKDTVLLAPRMNQHHWQMIHHRRMFQLTSVRRQTCDMPPNRASTVLATPDWYLLARALLRAWARNVISTLMSKLKAWITIVIRPGELSGSRALTSLIITSNAAVGVPRAGRLLPALQEAR